MILTTWLQWFELLPTAALHDPSGVERYASGGCRDWRAYTVALCYLSCVSTSLVSTFIALVKGVQLVLVSPEGHVTFQR